MRSAAAARRLAPVWESAEGGPWRTLLELLIRERDRDITVPQILRDLDLGVELADGLREQIASLERENLVVHHRRGRLRLRTKLHLVVGRLSIPARSREIGGHWGATGAFGFVGSADPGGDLYVPSRGLSGARHGDTVLAREIEAGRSKRRQGEVVAILERAPSRFAGEVILSEGRLRIRPRDEKLATEVALIEEPQLIESEEGHERRTRSARGAVSRGPGGGTPRRGGRGMTSRQPGEGSPLRGDRELASPSKQAGAAGREGSSGKSPGPQPGDLVIAELVGGRADRAHVVEVIGPADAPGAAERLVRAELALPAEFPPALEAEAGRIAERGIQEGDLHGRVDFRVMDTITIDPADARDFDDAVGLERLEGGAVRLWAHIADVAHYVLPGGALDREALARGTSVYFPGSVIPMLPHALSSGICSLREGEDRLVQSVGIDYDREGRLKAVRFTDGVIRCTARLTYEQAAEAMTDRSALSAMGEKGERAASLLAQLAPLARILTRRRIERGALDLDLPEIEFDPGKEGAPVALRVRDRTEAHRMIEEFMLAANEAVARHLVERKAPSLHRVHEPPDPEDVREVEESLAEVGVRPGRGGSQAGKLQRILTLFRGRPEEAIVSRFVLRAMKLARYAPEPGAHFGLALDRYTHFTSPIRRYPDLIVHRVLKSVRGARGGEADGARGGRVDGTGGGSRYAREALEPMASESSRLERRAEEAERAVNDLLAARHMLPMIGRELGGRVSGKVRSGIFVALEGEGFPPGSVEGFAPVARSSSFALTEAVRVRLEEVDLLRGRLRLSLLEV